MNVAAVGAGASNVQFSEVTAVIKRADGRTERLVLSQFESEEHREKREALGLELPAPSFNDALAPPSAFGRLLKWVGLSALAFAVSHFAPEYGPSIAATVIVNGGQAIVTNRMISAGTEPKFVAWGTGAGTAAVTDTTLFTESTDEARTSGTSSRVTTTVTNDTYQVVGTITVVTAGKTITNVGLFDASTSGNLYFKSDFTGLALLVGDSITFTIKVKFS